MEVEKNWVIKITERERDALDFWFAACQEAEVSTCMCCVFQIACAKLARGLDLEED